jgi:hypothetical protein
MRSLLTWLLLLAALIAGAASESGLALAQACSTDAQCGPSAGGYNVCLGDTLIMRRRICVAGQCLEQETGRMTCGGGGIGGTCEGNTYVRGGGGCDALSGRCTQGSTIRQTCTRSCSCVGRTLVISTGTCSPGVGCVRTTLRCKVGCTCSPEPRCTDEPTKEPQRTGAIVPGAKPAPSVNTLPPRTAEPFDATAPTPAVVRAKPAAPRITRKKRGKRYR